MALVGMAWLLSACGMFQIRDAVAPLQGGAVPEKAPISAENVLFNFSSAVSHKADGLYERCLSDDFALVLDQLDYLELGTGIAVLDKGKDVEAQRRFDSATADSILFEFGTKAPEGGTGSDSTYYQDIPYEMTFRRLDGGTWVEVDSLRVAGTIRLSLQRGSDENWTIRTWIDQRVEGAKSFGRLHAELAPL